VSERRSRRLDSELPNADRGSETGQATNLAEGDYLPVVLLGSHYCSRSRRLVRALSGHHAAATSDGPGDS